MTTLKTNPRRKRRRKRRIRQWRHEEQRHGRRTWSE
jgi:hypothetical protein